MQKMPTYEQLLAENAKLKEKNQRQLERIAFLERALYKSKSDRISYRYPADQPGLFDEVFNKAMDEKAAQIKQAVVEIEKEAEARRAGAKSANRESGLPQKPSS